MVSQNLLSGHLEDVKACIRQNARISDKAVTFVEQEFYPQRNIILLSPS